MKLHLLALLIACSATAADVRVINGQRVDVAPVTEWLAKRQGARPLPHWQSLRIYNVIQTNGVCVRCDVLKESGATGPVWLANVPLEILSAMEELKALEPKAKALNARANATSHALQAKTGKTTPAEEMAAKSVREQATQAQRRVGTLKNRKYILIAMQRGQWNGAELWDCGVREK